jgi:serine/threonine protein kinase
MCLLTVPVAINMTTFLSIYMKDKLNRRRFVGHMVVDLMKALNYIHKETKITHRDIRPQNILIRQPTSDKIVPMLGDWGFGGTELKKFNCGKVNVTFHHDNIVTKKMDYA